MPKQLKPPSIAELAREQALQEIEDPNRFPPVTIRYLALARRLNELGDVARAIRDDPDFPHQHDPEEVEGDVSEAIAKAERTAWMSAASTIWVSKGANKATALSPRPHVVIAKDTKEVARL